MQGYVFLMHHDFLVQGLFKLPVEKTNLHPNYTQQKKVKENVFKCSLQ